MSNNTTHQRPIAVQYVRYCYGRRLPDSMRDWVRNDLAGKGATARMMMRRADGARQLSQTRGSPPSSSNACAQPSKRSVAPVSSSR
jgi:hypothetical protein